MNDPENPFTLLTGIPLDAFDRVFPLLKAVDQVLLIHLYDLSREERPRVCEVETDILSERCQMSVGRVLKSALKLSTVGIVSRPALDTYQILLDDSPSDADVARYAAALSDYTQAKDASRIVGERAPLKGYVYLLAAEGYFKIGRTKNIPQRVSDINLQLPFKAALVHRIACGDMVTVESQLHRHFADKRLNGEWFRLEPEDVEYIKGFGDHREGKG